MGFQDTDVKRMTVTWLAYKNLPFSFFDDAPTQNFFKALGTKEKLPLRNAMRDQVLSEYEKMREKVVEIFKKITSKFAFSIDGWSNRNGSSFYGITVHCIDDRWKLISIALDLVEARGKHKGKDIAQLFFKVIKSYNIENKVSGVTMDNASIF